MRIFLVIAVFLQLSWACSGDCLSCHPKLKATILTDKRHSPMLTCIACHKEETSGQSACGNDCFSCHPIDKIDPSVKEHKVINDCRNCHMKMPKQLQKQLKKPQQRSKETSLEDLLFSK